MASAFNQTENLFVIEDGILKEIQPNSETSLTIPEGVTEIADYAFSNLEFLKTVTFNNDLESIGNYAFSGCNNLEAVSLPDSVITIGLDAFSYCSNLKSLSLAKALLITPDLCQSCSSLEAITVSEENERYTSVDTVLFDKEMKTIVFYPTKHSGTEYTIPEGVISIGKKAFQENSFLVSINLPSTLERIGYGAFNNTSVLESISFPDGLKQIDRLAFSSVSKPKEITIPASVEWIGGSAFINMDALENVTIQGMDTKMGLNPFYKYEEDLPAVTVHCPAGSAVESIGKENPDWFNLDIE